MGALRHPRRQLTSPKRAPRGRRRARCKSRRPQPLCLGTLPCSAKDRRTAAKRNLSVAEASSDGPLQPARCVGGFAVGGRGGEGRAAGAGRRPRAQCGERVDESLCKDHIGTVGRARRPSGPAEAPCACGRRFRTRRRVAHGSRPRPKLVQKMDCEWLTVDRSAAGWAYYKKRYSACRRNAGTWRRVGAPRTSMMMSSR
jgi:hypothetical protein